MLIVIYVFLLPICSFILCVFGFFVGRCARKLPVIDNGLPWAISRSQIPRPPDLAEPSRDRHGARHSLAFNHQDG